MDVDSASAGIRFWRGRISDVLVERCSYFNLGLGPRELGFAGGCFLREKSL